MGTNRMAGAAVALAVAGAALASHATVSFTTAPYVAGAYTRSVVFADLDRDGRPDMLVACTGENNLAVFHGNGDGTFRTPPAKYPTGSRPISVAAGDLDGDGNPDAVVSIFDGSLLQAFRGDGAGGLAFWRTIGPVNRDPIFAFVDDVNHDGRNDIVSVQYYPGGATVFLNNGSGFTAASTFSAGTHVHWAAMADFDGDGYRDLVMANSFSGNTSVHRSLGNGSFVNASALISIPFPYSVAAGDYDGDGLPDLAVLGGNFSPPYEVRVYRGNGAFGFTRTHTLAGGFGPCIEFADVDGDGLDDLHVVGDSFLPSSVLHTYLADGTGGFEPRVDTPVGASPYYVAPADLDGDRDIDLVVANSGDPVSLTVLRNGATPSNRPPAAEAGPDRTVECASPGTSVALDGRDSSDPDGNPLTYVWTGDFIGGTATGATPTVVFEGSPAVHSVTLTVEDGRGGSSADTVLVTVIDTTAPLLSVSGLPTELWPPNHRMVRVLPSITSADACDSAPTVTVTVTSSEPDDGLGDGDTVGDVVVHSPADIEIRAERSGTGAGRTYTFTWTATDSSGNRAFLTTRVIVPKAQGKAK